MVAIKYDVSDVEAGGGGEQPQPGLYPGKIVSMTPRSQKSDGTKVSDLECVVDVGTEYARLWTYVKLPDDPNWSKAAHGWKLRELTDALGLPPKGSIDPKKHENQAVTVKVAADTDLEGNYRGKVKNLFLPGGETLKDDDPVAASEDVLTREELEGWSNEDLKGEISDRDLTLEGRFSKDKAVALLLSSQDAEPEPEPEPETETETGDGVAGDLAPELAAELNEDADYYKEWTDEDIKLFAEDLEITGNISGRKTRDKYIAVITSLAESVGGGEGDGGVATGSEAEPEPDDYDQWEANELYDEITTRNEQGAEIPVPEGRKTKEKAIAALRADDAKAEPF